MNLDLPDATDPAATTEECVGCRRPLTRRGPHGECLRCLVGFALEEVEVSVPLDAASDRSDAPTPTPLRYGHFEVAVGPDGLPVELGAGAMAVTYRAHDPVLHSAVALKVINRALAGHPDARARFLREARAAARLHHPNVASVTHYGEQDGECYYAMELVEGETLEQKVRREGPLPPAVALEIGVQVARALAAAEACGVAHRDLKPSNLMLTARQGETGEGDGLVVKVIDWGLAKAVSAELALGADHTHGAFVGTPAFASPEQFTPDEDGRIDTRSDIYSLGVTLWYLLCGHGPFTGSAAQVIYARQTGRAPPMGNLTTAGVPAPVVALLRAMLQANPAARPQSARELLGALRRCQEPTLPGGKMGTLLPLPPGGRRRARAVLALGLLALGTAAFVGWWIYVRSPEPSPDRSIAVLPFENLSPDPADAFFTVGVQDEITADLARVGALRVIGAESTRTYPPKDRDLSRIGRELGVRYLLEGSAGRANDQFDVTVRLVDLHDPRHPWSGRYERGWGDVVGLPGEITRAMTERMQASLSVPEKAALARPPTLDPVAYDLYLRAQERPLLPDEAAVRQESRRRIVLLEAAVARDPTFALAYCALGHAHDRSHALRFGAKAEELTVDHRSRAEVALEKARRLQPDAGELHLALAYHFFWVSHDNGQARLEAELARRALPNSGEAEYMVGRIARLEGNWEEAVRSLEKAVALEPRATGIRDTLGMTYACLRRYGEFDREMARIIALTPAREMADNHLLRALGPLEGQADVAPLRAALAAPPPANDPDGRLRANYELVLRLFEHDADGVSRLLAAREQAEFLIVGFPYPRAWFEALAARMRGDEAGAREAFAAARTEVARSVRDDPADGWSLGLLAMVDAGLGRKPEAVAEARRACELVPLETQAVSGPTIRCCLATVYAWTDQPELALAELEKLVVLPAGSNLPKQPTYGDLRLNPLWDPLRADPRFATLVQRLAPDLPR